MGREKKDEFGSNWWAQKWNGTLEGFGWSNRLQRGRAYARTGHVLSISLNPGLVEAKVQGSKPKPYKVSIEMDKLSDKEWKAVISKMAEKAIFSAKLLTGEMPENIEEAFKAAGTPLFPTSSKSIRTNCSCPDYANPCKHIAAVYYVIGQEFDKDPFMIFYLRGMGKDDLMESLKKVRNGKPPELKNNMSLEKSALVNESCSENKNSNIDSEDSELFSILKELQEEIKLFEGLDEAIKNMTFCFDSPQVPYSIIKRLGIPPFFKEKDLFKKLMAFYYDKAENKANDLINNLDNPLE